MIGTHRLLWLAIPLLSGCALVGRPEPRPADTEPAAPQGGKVEAPLADCQALELDALSEEISDPRERTFDRVRFRYASSSAIVDAVVAAKPAYVFVFAHGWMNDVQSSREFSGNLLKGVLTRAERDGVAPSSLAFIAIHWDSKRLIFHESAVNAEVIGRKRVAPLLDQLAARAPGVKVVLVGHSLGGRLMLSALAADGPPDQLRAHGAVLLEAAADQDSLLPSRQGSLIGGFPGAPGRARTIVNVHSHQDSVLEVAYKNAMQALALGREGAWRANGEAFAELTLGTDPVQAAAFEAALAQPGAAWPGGPDRVLLNVDATAIVPGHSEIFNEKIFDLIWRVASR